MAFENRVGGRVSGARDQVRQLGSRQIAYASACTADCIVEDLFVCAVGHHMERQHKRYRAFISYSQRDKPIARRLHKALEAYRVPHGVGLLAGTDRRLGRFFRDDEEMGAGQSLGSALEGALDDAENLIVICSPAAAQSKWVDAEVRRFKRRGDARVFAVIVDGEPNARDAGRECFPPALKTKIDRDGRPTGEPDEPRAPDFRRDGMARVRAQLAAGLLDLPFDTLWQRDRRRARHNAVLWSAAGAAVAGVLVVLGFSLNNEQIRSRQQAARDAATTARRAAADGQVGAALNAMAPFVADSDTFPLVDAPLRAVLGWVPDPRAALKPSGLQLVGLRDATLLLDPKRGAYDLTDIGLTAERLIRSRDGERLLIIGPQRSVVVDATGQRLATLDNAGVSWIGHAFEAPSGLLVVAGAHVGNTTGSIRPHVLAISADGKSARSHAIGSDQAAVTAKCDHLLVLEEGHVKTRALAAQGLGEPAELPRSTAPGRSDASGKAQFSIHDAFLGRAKANPFTVTTCQSVAMDDGFDPGRDDLSLLGAHMVVLDPVLAFEGADRWASADTTAGRRPVPAPYVPACTEERPCALIGRPADDTFVPDNRITMEGDEVGPLSPPRWLRREAATALSTNAPLYFEYRVFNAGQVLTACRPEDAKDLCFRQAFEGGLPPKVIYLRSPDGRYLFWHYGGSILDLEKLQPLTANGTIPRTPGQHFDFEFDRPGLTLAVDGRLVSYGSNGGGDRWERSGDERASPPFGVLAIGAEGQPSLHTLASLGKRNYLAVRSDGDMARLDATTGRELWRIKAVELGDILDVQLNAERRHVLLMGKKAWRVFQLTDGTSLSDGYAVSGLLVPPPVLAKTTELSDCRLADALDAEGGFVASCGAAAFGWQPRAYRSDDLPARLSRAICATDVKTSALEVVQRCFVDQQ